MKSRFKEDELFDKVFPILKRFHRIPKKHKVEFHKRLRGYEIDVYITWRSSGWPHIKSMIVELKEIDMPKLIDQVVRRRDLALFAYAVINIPVDKLFRWLIQYHLDLAHKLVDHNIGLITFDRSGNPVLLLRSDQSTRWILDKYLKGEVEVG